MADGRAEHIRRGREQTQTHNISRNTPIVATRPSPDLPSLASPSILYDTRDMETPDFPPMLVNPNGSPVVPRLAPMHRHQLPVPGYSRDGENQLHFAPLPDSLENSPARGAPSQRNLQVQLLSPVRPLSTSPQCVQPIPTGFSAPAGITLPESVSPGFMKLPRAQSPLAPLAHCYSVEELKGIRDYGFLNPDPIDALLGIPPPSPVLHRVFTRQAPTSIFTTYEGFESDETDSSDSSVDEDGPESPTSSGQGIVESWMRHHGTLRSDLLLPMLNERLVSLKHASHVDIIARVQRAMAEFTQDECTSPEFRKRRISRHVIRLERLLPHLFQPGSPAEVADWHDSLAQDILRRTERHRLALYCFIQIPAAFWNTHVASIEDVALANEAEFVFPSVLKFGAGPDLNLMSDTPDGLELQRFKTLLRRSFHDLFDVPGAPHRVEVRKAAERLFGVLDVVKQRVDWHRVAELIRRNQFHEDAEYWYYRQLFGDVKRDESLDIKAFSSITVRERPKRGPLTFPTNPHSMVPYLPSTVEIHEYLNRMDFLAGAFNRLYVERMERSRPDKVAVPCLILANRARVAYVRCVRRIKAEYSGNAEFLEEVM
ncbi:hypothetical protein BXZ70DRAFT_1013035 [Cristinia sonorae]|uniref:Uncharacterized protein n=1 Tax=Cristinia sonorae TaxID=1940300 RepID=A0A8K0XK87_9AGAR|nr:hypothetical protein BXZ70DRAFT_1013035 [Cristinia sonorae]